MRKIVSLFVLCVWSAPYVSAWGLLPEAAYTGNWFASILGKQQITQPVCVTTYAGGEVLPGLPADSRVSQEKLILEFENALNYWLTKPRDFLQKSGRSAEFADFLSVLPQRISLQPNVDCTAPGTLRLVYAPREWYIHMQRQDGRVVAVTHKVRYTVPTVRASNEIAWTESYASGGTVTLYERLDLINLPQVLAHEAGHLIGLTNQYGFASYLFPGENMHSYFSYLHVTGKNTGALKRVLLNRKPASLMGAPSYHAQAMKNMWPDDVDGLINAVDMVQVYLRGVLSPRVVNGWKSFSLADKNIGYALGMPFQYAQDSMPEGLLARATEYAGGKIGGLELQDLALLQAWYKQTDPETAYTAVNAEDLHNWQTAEVIRRETAYEMESLSLQPVKGMPVTEHRLTAPNLPLSDLIPLRVPDTDGELRTLTPVKDIKKDDPDCNFYLIITDKEMNWFEKEYGSVLERAQRKTDAHKNLTKKETRITRWYKQMKENQRKTAKCWVEPVN